METQCKQQMWSLVVPAQGSLEYNQNPGNTEIHVTSIVRLRLAPHTVPLGLMVKEPFE